jgi:hypothetical protein
MAWSPAKIWVATPPIVRATLYAAWVASKVGSISLAALFTVGNLALGVYEIAAGHAKILELPGVIVGGVLIFVLSLLFGLLIAVPLSAVVAACAYPFLRALQATDRKVFGAVGFLIGVFAWLGIFWSGPAGSLYFGSWSSMFAIGRVAGCAGGLAFARRFPLRH